MVVPVSAVVLVPAVLVVLAPAVVVVIAVVERLVQPHKQEEYHGEATPSQVDWWTVGRNYRVHPNRVVERGPVAQRRKEPVANLLLQVYRNLSSG